MIRIKNSVNYYYGFYLNLHSFILKNFFTIVIIIKININSTILAE
jgi:hypothetical protein